VLTSLISDVVSLSFDAMATAIAKMDQGKRNIFLEEWDRNI